MFLKSWSRYDTVSCAAITAGILALDYAFNPVGFWHAIGVLLG